MARSALFIIAAVYLLASACGPAGPATNRAEDPRQVADATVAFWSQRATADPADFVALAGLGSAHAARARLTGDVADYAAAREHLSAAYTMVPGDADTKVQLGFVEGALHDFEGALALAGSALALEPSNASAHALRGDALMALGRYAEVEAAYLEARRLAPGLETWARLALYHAYSGDHEEAALSWDIALTSVDLAPPAAAAWALTEAGRFSLAHGDLSLAERRFIRALQIVDGYLPAGAALADLYAARGEIERAIEEYRTVVGTRPAVEYLVALGELFEAAGDPVAAGQQYAVVAGIDALYRAAGVDTDLAMARFHALHGDPARALELAVATYDARPTADAADALALALDASGRPHEALAYAGQAVVLSPANATFHLHAGAIAMVAGDSAMASARFATALDINPYLRITQGELAVVLASRLAEVLG